MILEFQFHDNDFHTAFTGALEYLWTQLALNNGWGQYEPGTCLQRGPEGKALSQIVFKLEEQNALRPICDRILEAHALLQSADQALRFADSDFFLERIIGNKSFTQPVGLKYLGDYKIALHSKAEWQPLKENWQNGEYFYIDLETGEIGSR